MTELSLGAAPVTVVVPVYRDADDVRRCLDSVLVHAATSVVPTELLVVDDASPEPEVRDAVDEVASRATAVPTRVVRHDENLGFVAAVNRALDETRGDVVVLNADTVVTAGWLDRLTEAAYSVDDVATVTPLTNFGSICTVPEDVIAAFDLDAEPGRDREGPAIDACADFVATASLRLRPDVITGVGFCLYLRRDAVDACGRFDEDAFGLGYGEEVDFCLRATRLGFVHLVEDSTFVYHRGGGSFGSRREEGLARGSARLHERYPFFRDANLHDRRTGSLRTALLALRQALHPRDAGRPHVLHLLHNSPDSVGGTEKHLRALLDALAEDVDHSILFPVESGFVLRSSWRWEGEWSEEEILLPGGARRVTALHDELAGAALATALDLYDVDAVHIHNLIGHSLAPLEVLRDFTGHVVCSVRDLYLACPNHSLLFRGETACGIPDDLAVCAECLPVTTGLQRDDLERFRRLVGDRLDAVDHWVFASRSAADYFLRAYPLDGDRIEIIEHGAIIGAERRRPLDEARILDEPLRLAFVGIGRTKKGLGVVNRLAEHFTRSPIEVHHFGELKEQPAPSLRTHGPYDNEQLPVVLADAGIQIVLLPAPYAETFGHVMTEALMSGLPVIGTRYGALGERIRRHRAGWTVDPEDVPAIIELVEDLDRCRLELLRATRRAREVAGAPVASTANRYAALYLGGEPDGRGRAASP